MPDEKQDKYKVTTWGGGTRDLEVPSGQVCLVRKSSVTTLMAAGVIHSMDSLTAFVDAELIAPAEGKRPPKKPTGATNAQALEMLNDPKKFTELVHLLDRVTTHIVLQPHIEMTPNDKTRRKDDVVYADQVDLEDKLFIFQYAVGGLEDVQQFRQGADEAVGGVDAVAQVGSSTE